MDSEFCVATGITNFEDKGVYAKALIKKRRYWQRGVHGDLIDTHSEDKEVSDIGMIEARTEDIKLFKKNCMKYPDDVIKIMASYVTPEKLEAARTRKYFMDSNGKKDMKLFTYWQQF